MVVKEIGKETAIEALKGQGETPAQPFHFEEKSTLSPSTFGPPPPHFDKPIIPTPDANPIKIGALQTDLVRMLDLAEEMKFRIMEGAKGRIDDLTLEISKFQQRECDKMQELIDKNNESSWWDFFTRIGSVLVSCVSIVLGGALIATLNPLSIAAGSCMIAGGLGSITALILRECGVSAYIWGAIAVTSAVIGLTGSVMGLVAGPALNLGQLVGQVISAAFNIGQGVTQIGSSVTRYQGGMLSVELTGIRKEIERRDNVTEEVQTDTTSMLERLGIHRQVSEAGAVYDNAKEIMLNANVA